MREVDRRQRIHSLDFKDDLVLNEDVDTIADVCQLLAVLNDRHRHFGTHIKTHLSQFIDEAGRISRFKQSGTERSMHAEGSVEDLTR